MLLFMITIIFIIIATFVTIITFGVLVWVFSLSFQEGVKQEGLSHLLDSMSAGVYIY
jgi:predicted Zn-dependent peptidase